MAYAGALLLDPTRKTVLTQPPRLTSLAQIGGDRVATLLAGRISHDTMAYHVAPCASPSDLATWASFPSRPAGAMGGTKGRAASRGPCQSLVEGMNPPWRPGWVPPSGDGGSRSG